MTKVADAHEDVAITVLCGVREIVWLGAVNLVGVFRACVLKPADGTGPKVKPVSFRIKQVQVTYPRKRGGSPHHSRVAKFIGRYNDKTVIGGGVEL